ncbi:nitrilase 2 [Heterostelium album PN500]|uniref:Nitrilase 2 n=1 Tax=Heterostelium pallidum (strain ATCC 26659 / Pp 5 / PN500) TaxID=670386 RepID=D3BLP1_HETP5|nr:nitrilase 2 [Heterostelium album PN500]EFA77492.1 nitrilase 2 [Heterostelium album PN500]|eukprot:XP_020429620.1 nitrilase 2 [Heterostelium album PN500]
MFLSGVRLTTATTTSRISYSHLLNRGCSLSGSYQQFPNLSISKSILSSSINSQIQQQRYFSSNKNSNSSSSSFNIRPRNRPIDIEHKMNEFNSDKIYKFAGIQLLVGEDKNQNIEAARKAIEEAASNGANIICLPECFNCPYSTSVFNEYAEKFGGPTTTMLADAAKRLKIWLIGGSIPERGDDGKIYNCSFIFNPSGELVGKHRKIHLFDINVPGKITFRESEILSPGETPTIIELGDGVRLGVGICYDIRFPELAMLYAKEGCQILVYPGAFNMTTGPAHWELLQRGRAVDNQVYVAAVSPARNPKSTYTAWGHSTVVSPWGDIVSTTEHDPTIIYANIELAKVKEMRTNIPVYQQKKLTTTFKI